MASPGGVRGRLSILIFHRVLPATDPLFPREMTAATFRERMLWVRECAVVLPLADAVSALQRGRLPPRALSITFDDGYADNAAVALPILRELGLHATFFVTTGTLDGGRMWNDTVIEAIRGARAPTIALECAGLGDREVATVAAKRQVIGELLTAFKHLPPAERAAKAAAVASACGAALPDDLMMTRGQVRSLVAAGMDLGAHTVSHPILSALDESTARSEIAAGRDALYALARVPVRLFAYPNGSPTNDYRRLHVDMVRSLGFTAAVSTAWGAARRGDDPFELPRFTPWDTTAGRFALRLARNALRAPARAAA
jgi:peptidoglycan/xylan/chitin deacetylase (PgdA/CDA1 family)